MQGLTASPSIRIEAYIRASTSDFEFTSRLYGVQLVASWYQRK